MDINGISMETEWDLSSGYLTQQIGSHGPLMINMMIDL